MNLLLSVIGLAGGLICVVADLLLDLKGNENQKLGKNGFIDSKWDVMPKGRFVASVILAMFAVPMYSMGIISLANQIGTADTVLADILKLVIFLGAMGGFFIHVFACIMPVIYKDIKKEASLELADTVLGNMFRAVSVPFIVLYLILLFGTTGIIVYSILMGLLEVPKWFILLNPVVIQVIGWILRAFKKKWFCDVPAVCAASLGLAMFGVIGIVNLM